MVLVFYLSVTFGTTLKSVITRSFVNCGCIYENRITPTVHEKYKYVLIELNKTLRAWLRFYDLEELIIFIFIVFDD